MQTPRPFRLGFTRWPADLTLAADDAIHLADDEPVGWRNPGKARAVVLSLTDAGTE